MRVRDFARKYLLEDNPTLSFVTVLSRHLYPHMRYPSSVCVGAAEVGREKGRETIPKNGELTSFKIERKWLAY